MGTHKELIPISTRMTAFDPNARLKGISLVLEYAVILIAHKVLDNFSTHKLFASSNLFLILLFHLFLFVNFMKEKKSSSRNYVKST